MKKLRIGVVVDQLLAGGVQLSAVEQIKELNRQGHQAKLLILMRKKYPTDFSYLVANVPHEYVSDNYPKILQHTIKLPFFSFLSTLHLISPLLAPLVIQKKSYDVLISWGTTTCLTTQALYQRNHIPYIAIIHDPITYILNKVYANTYLRYFFWILLPLAARIEASFIHDALETILISNVHKKYIIQSYKIKPIIIPLAVQVRKTPIRLGNDILSFGRWQKDKHPEKFIEIAKRIPKAQIVIAGSWITNEDKNNFLRLINQYHLQNRIKVISHYTIQELDRIAQKARLFIHPHFEAFGLAALEAAGMGLPIIIPYRSGVTEKFKDGIHGFFPQTNEELIRDTKKLLHNKKLAQYMGRHAYQVVKNEMSWKKHVEKILNIFSRIEKPLTNIAVLELGHVLGNSLSGGDKLLDPMARRMRKRVSFSIIVSSVGHKHWLKNPAVRKLYILPRSRFDLSANPFTIFCSYLDRLIRAVHILYTIDAEALYSSTNIFPDIFTAAVCKRKNQIWIARVHHLIPPPQARAGNLFINFGAFLLQKIALQLIKMRADLVIALNEPLRFQLQGMGIDRTKLYVLGGGIDITKYQSKKTIIKKFDGIFIGRLHPTKGIFDLPKIWASVVDENPSAKLAVVGTGAKRYELKLKQMISDAGLSKSIQLMGYVSDQKIIALLKSAKIFLFSDHEAGWGLAAAEALACGVPVVGYDIGILGNVFTNGFKQVRYADVIEFANKINELLVNKPVYRRLSQQALIESRNFDWNNTTRAFESIISRHITLQ